MATNEIASFCIDNRLRQKAFFVFAKVGKGRLSLKDFEIKLKGLSVVIFFREYIKQIDTCTMLPSVCSVIDHRRRQNVVRTSVTHSAIASYDTFFSYHILTSSVIYY